MKILHLNLKKEYFLDIKSQNKPFEFRLKTPYWKKRLIGKHYDEVHFKLGYPGAEDNSRIIKREYLGFENQEINHKHFGKDEVEVFAILTTGRFIV